MTRHNSNDRGTMGMVILAVTGLFFALHLALPETTLWPAWLITMGVVTMLTSHFGKSRRSRHTGEVISNNRR